MTTQPTNDPFNAIWRHLMFDILTDTPDPTILPFLKNHFPYLAKRPAPTEWTVYPPGDRPKPQHGLHSIRVEKHPFIKSNHSSARLDILSQEWKEGPPGIERIRVWIYFDTRADAESALNFLIKEFEKVRAKIERMVNENDEKILIKNSTLDEDWKFLTIVLNKPSTYSNYLIGILFYDDTGDPW